MYCSVQRASRPESGPIKSQSGTRNDTPPPKMLLHSSALRPVSKAIPAVQRACVHAPLRATGEGGIDAALPVGAGAHAAPPATPLRCSHETVPLSRRVVLPALSLGAFAGLAIAQEGRAAAAGTALAWQQRAMPPVNGPYAARAPTAATLTIQPPGPPGLPPMPGQPGPRPLPPGWPDAYPQPPIPGPDFPTPPVPPSVPEPRVLEPRAPPDIPPPLGGPDVLPPNIEAPGFPTPGGPEIMPPQMLPYKVRAHRHAPSAEGEAASCLRCMPMHAQPPVQSCAPYPARLHLCCPCGLWLMARG